MGSTPEGKSGQHAAGKNCQKNSCHWKKIQNNCSMQRKISGKNPAAGENFSKIEHQNGLFKVFYFHLKIQVKMNIYFQMRILPLV